MKRLLLPLLALLIPSAHAVDYVQCEAIRNILVRNEMQREDKEKLLRSQEISLDDLRYSKYKVYYCELLKDPKIKAECSKLKKPTYDLSEELKPYDDIDKRLVKDFTNKGCYWF